MNFDLDKHTILKVIHGSQSYGTALPESDVDTKGIAVPPLEHMKGFFYRFDQAETKKPDCAIYGVQKFFKLASDCNPNIIEVLFTDESNVLVRKPAGLLLMDNAQMFLSKKARHTFSGYAHAQLKRIKTHRSWLLNPPKEKPTREAFGLDPTRKSLNSTTMGAIQSLEKEDWELGGEVMRVFSAEKAYLSAVQHWKQYQNWVATRNPARAELEVKYGYDTKHAMHLVRLMRMCVEILRDGVVVVRRPDAEELLEIRAGAWSYEKIIEWAEKQDKLCDDLYESSALPHKPPVKKLEELCVQVVDYAIGAL